MRIQHQIRSCAAAAAALLVIAVAPGAGLAQATAADPRPAPALEPARHGPLRAEATRSPTAVLTTPWVGGQPSTARSLADTLLLGAVEPLSPAPGIVQFSDDRSGQPPALARLSTRGREGDRPGWPLWTGLLLTGAALAIQYDGLETDESRPTKNDPTDESTASTPLADGRQPSDNSDALRNASLLLGAAGLVFLAAYFFGGDAAPTDTTAHASASANGSLQVAVAENHAAVGWERHW